MKRIARACGVVGAAALAGCAVGPDYKTPEAKAPEGFAEAGPGGTTPAEPEASALAVWWTGFNDATLDSLVARAIEGNLDLRIAEARVREARAARGVVAADALPNVDAVGAYERQRQSKALRQFSGGSLENDLFQAGFDATWEIDVFGKVKRGVESADASVGSAIENRRDALVTLVSEVARNYVEARTFQRRLAITRDNLRTQREGVSLSKSRFQAGLTNELDVKQAETLASTTEAQIPALESGERQAIHRLGVLLGVTPGTLLDELTPAAPIPAHGPEVAVGMPSALLQRRPDIRRAERDLAGATADIGVATADLFPRFSITGTFGFASGKAGDLLDGNNRFWSVGPAVRWNVFDGGRIRANIKVQDARAEAALATYEQTILIALADVEDSLVAYSREQVRRVSLREAVDSSREALDLSNELYTRGLTTYLNVLDSQRALLSAEDGLAQSDSAVAASLIALYKALGGGWDTSMTREQEEAALRPAYTGMAGEAAAPAQ